MTIDHNKKTNHNLKETVEHGNILFNLAVHLTQHKNATDIMLYTHWHEELEILYIIEGSMFIQIETQSIVVKKGDIIFIPPNTIHGATRFNQSPCDFYAIVFHPSFINSAHQDIIQQNYITPFYIKPDKPYYFIEEQAKEYIKVIHFVHSIIESYNSKHFGFELLIKSYLLQLLFSILELQNIKEKEPIKTDLLTTQRIKKILSFLDGHYQQPFSLTNWAKSIDLSKEQFCRLFKKQFNNTPMNYLLHYRLSKSADLLIHTHKPIIDIALETGFDSANYFTIAFKNKTHVTPSEFRKRYKKTDH